MWTRRNQAPALTVALAWAAVTVASAQTPVNVWVATETGRVLVVDHGTFGVGTPIVLPSSGVAEPPGCVAPSTEPGVPRHAFVTHGPYVHAIEASNQTILLPPRDVGAEIGISGLVLRGCSASVPREFGSTSGSVVRSYLFVVADRPTGGAIYVILDQAVLLSGSVGGPSAVVAWGGLDPSSEALDVRVLETPLGPHHVRAWFSLRRPLPAGEGIVQIPLFLGAELGDTPTVGDPEVTFSPLPAAPPLRIGAPFGRELVVVPAHGAETLEAPEFGRSCPLDGDVVGAFVSGPGPNSYNLAVTRFPRSLLLVDPNTCETRSISVGLSPVATAPVTPFFWNGAYVANRDSFSLSYVYPDGQVAEIALGTANGSPAAMDVFVDPPCAVTKLQVNAVAADLDGIEDDVQLNWSGNTCPANQEYSVWCACLDASPIDCDCACDCDAEPPPADCACPVLAEFPGPINDFLVDFPPGDQPSTNPWKKLESVPSVSFLHENQGKTPPSWVYSVTPNQEPPESPPPPP